MNRCILKNYLFKEFEKQWNPYLIKICEHRNDYYIE